MSEKDKENKRKALEAVMASLNKKHGKGTIMSMGDESIDRSIRSVSTGSLLVDQAIGPVGGLPRGRIVEIYGPESSGKTTLTLSAIAQAQKAGLTCAFIDAEHALDINYAKSLGVDVDSLLLSQPDYGEQALEVAESLTRSGAVDMIVIDSVAALTPKAEIEGDIGDSHMGLAARMMSQAMRKIAGFAKENEVLLVFINQIRMKIGVMFGSPETTTGGNALKFYASLRIDIRRTGAIKNGEEVIGSKTKVKIIKNKVGSPFKEAETEIIYGKGFNIYSEVIDIADKLKIINKAGSWYSYNDEKLGQGKNNVIDILQNNSAMYEEILAKIKEKGSESLKVEDQSIIEEINLEKEFSEEEMED